MIVRQPVGPVQVLPPGLINLLQLKVGGYVPDALRQDIQPTIDLESWWLRATKRIARQIYTSATPAGTWNDLISVLAAGGGNLAPGPKAWWYVHNVSIIASSVTAATTNLQLGIREQGGSRPGPTNDALLMTGTFVPSLAAGVSQIFHGTGLWMPPGSSVGVHVGTVGVGGTLNMSLLGFSYSELEI